jgi:hypothetical protein
MPRAFYRLMHRYAPALGLLALALMALDWLASLFR